MLLTSLPVGTFAQAAQCVRWYRCRWVIERYHLVLKSGCRIEELHVETAERLERALATYGIVAWRLLWLTMRHARGRRRRVKSCCRRMHGKPSTPTSTRAPRSRSRRRLCERRPAGSPSWEASWPAPAMGTLGCKPSAGVAPTGGFGGDVALGTSCSH